MRQEDINPPAIVREAEESINDLEAAIIDDHGHQQRHQAHSLEYARRMGQKLLRLKERIPYGQFEGRIEKKMPFKMRQAQKYMRIAREWDKLTEAHSGALLDVDNSARLLVEDAPAENGNSVPFSATGQPAKPAETAPEREPGDMTEEEEEQDQKDTQMAADIKAMLCLRCSRIGQPSCELCRGKAARIREGEKVKPGVRTKPNDPRDQGPKNGQMCFDWGAYNHDFSAFKCQIDKLCKGYEIPIVNPKAEGLRRRLDEIHDEFKAFAKEVTKQRVPDA